MTTNRRLGKLERELTGTPEDELPSCMVALTPEDYKRGNITPKAKGLRVVRIGARKYTVDAQGKVYDGEPCLYLEPDSLPAEKSAREPAQGKETSRDAAG